MNKAGIVGGSLALAAVLLASGCSLATRTVRQAEVLHWSSDDTFYLVYNEVTASQPMPKESDKNVTRVKMCRIQEDNALMCEEQEAPFQLLNPQEALSAAGQ